jgi:hypothetical protein
MLICFLGRFLRPMSLGGSRLPACIQANACEATLAATAANHSIYKDKLDPSSSAAIQGCEIENNMRGPLILETGETMVVHEGTNGRRVTGRPIREKKLPTHSDVRNSHVSVSTGETGFFFKQKASINKPKYAPNVNKTLQRRQGGACYLLVL